MRKSLIRGLIGSLVLSLAVVGGVSAAPGGNNAGDTLVNVQLSDVTIAAPIAIAANLCDVNINVLARQVGLGDTDCDADAESMASPGWNSGGGNQAGNSLVNVQVDDLAILVPISLAANICNVNVNVLATQLGVGGATCDAEAISIVE